MRLMIGTAAAFLTVACGDMSTNTTNLSPGNELGDDVAAGNAAAAVVPTAAEYVTKAAGSDLYEIEAAGLAEQKAANPEIRVLAVMIRDDHRRSTEQLTAAAGQMQPPMPVTPALDPAQQAEIEALRGATGPAFDQEYLRQQIAAHEAALAMVEGYAQSGDNEALRQHASSVAATIRQHLERARALNAPPPTAQ